MPRISRRASVRASTSVSRFDRDGARLAYTRVEPPGKEDLFFESTPSDPSDDEFLEFVGNVKPYQHNPFIGRDFCEDFFLFTS